MILRYILLLIIGLAIVVATWLLFLKPATPVAIPNQVIQSEWADLYSVQNDVDLQALKITTQDIFTDFTTKSSGRDGWQTFSKDNDSVIYKINGISCKRFENDEFFYNPYGLWSLGK